MSSVASSSVTRSPSNRAPLGWGTFTAWMWSQWICSNCVLKISAGSGGKQGSYTGLGKVPNKVVTVCMLPIVNIAQIRTRHRDVFWSAHQRVTADLYSSSRRPLRNLDWKTGNLKALKRSESPHSIKTDGHVSLQSWSSPVLTSCSHDPHLWSLLCLLHVRPQETSWGRSRGQTSHHPSTKKELLSPLTSWPRLKPQNDHSSRAGGSEYEEKQHRDEDEVIIFVGMQQWVGGGGDGTVTLDRGRL